MCSHSLYPPELGDKWGKLVSQSPGQAGNLIFGGNRYTHLYIDGVHIALNVTEHYSG